MLFSTKAEYGIRLMVALGRREGERPVALAALAEGDTLPLSYLEHLVAKLRAADLVTSQRGAHGGYRLARPAEDIRMLEVVEALQDLLLLGLDVQVLNLEVSQLSGAPIALGCRQGWWRGSRRRRARPASCRRARG